jgi:hypothetical protein
MLLLPSHHAAAAREDRTGQSGSLQNGHFCGGFGSTPAVATASFSKLSMFHITCTSWYPQVCTSW